MCYKSRTLHVNIWSGVSILLPSISAKMESVNILLTIPRQYMKFYSILLQRLCFSLNSFFPIKLWFPFVRVSYESVLYMVLHVFCPYAALPFFQGVEKL